MVTQGETPVGYSRGESFSLFGKLSSQAERGTRSITEP